MKKLAVTTLLTLGFLILAAKPAAAFEAHVISVTARIQLSDVLLNEVYANVNTGEDEWVELYNRSGSAVDISGWVIRDPINQPSHKIVVPAGTTLAAGAKYRGYFTTSVLNDDGDTVYLFDADGRMRDKFVYTETIKGKSWRRNPDGSGNWVDPEPSSPSEPSPPSQPEPNPDEPSPELEPEPPTSSPETEVKSEPEVKPEPELEIEAPPEASESAEIVEPDLHEASKSAELKKEEPVDEA